MHNAPQSEEREREKRLLGIALRLGMTDIIVREERLRLQAQYEDKNFIRLIGLGMIKPYVT